MGFGEDCPSVAVRSRAMVMSMAVGSGRRRPVVVSPASGVVVGVAASVGGGDGLLPSLAAPPLDRVGFHG